MRIGIPIPSPTPRVIGLVDVPVVVAFLVADGNVAGVDDILARTVDGKAWYIVVVAMLFLEDPVLDVGVRELVVMTTIGCVLVTANRFQFMHAWEDGFSLHGLSR